MHRGFAEAPTALMRSTIVVFDQPGVEIGLQLVDRVIDLLAERDPVKLVQDSAMEALADSVRLRALGLCAAVIDGALMLPNWLYRLCAAVIGSTP